MVSINQVEVHKSAGNNSQDYCNGSRNLEKTMETDLRDAEGDRHLQGGLGGLGGLGEGKCRGKGGLY